MDKMNWNEFIEKEITEQITIINEILIENADITVSKISKDVFNQSKQALSRHLNKLGYKYDNRQYISNSNQNKTTNDTKGAKEDMTLEMYSIINQKLKDLDVKETERATVKIAKDTTNKLNDFLKEHRILNKQDVISVALEMFLEKYNKA